MTVITVAAALTIAQSGVSLATTDALFDSFGVGNMHGSVTHTIPHPNPVFGPPGHDEDYPGYAVQFSPTKSGTATNIDVVVQTKFDGNIVGGLYLFTDANDSIGEYLGVASYSAMVSVYFPLKPNTPLHLASSGFFLSPLPPQLTAGTKYWLIFSGYNSTSAGGLDLFAAGGGESTRLTEISDVRFLQLSGLTYQSGGQVAFRINGTLVPEATITLHVALAFGVLTLRGARQR